MRESGARCERGEKVGHTRVHPSAPALPHEDTGSRVHTERTFLKDCGWRPWVRLPAWRPWARDLLLITRRFIEGLFQENPSRFGCLALLCKQDRRRDQASRHQKCAQFFTHLSDLLLSRTLPC